MLPLFLVVVLLGAGQGVRLPEVARKGEPTKFLKMRLEKPTSSHCTKYSGKYYYSTVTLEQGDSVLLPCQYCGLYGVREKQWFRTEFVWRHPWDVQAKMRRLGSKKKLLLYTSPLDLMGRMKKKHKKFLMTKEEEKEEARRLRRLKGAAPWPTSRGVTREFSKKVPADFAVMREKQRTLLEVIWRYKLYHREVSLGEEKKFLSEYRYKERVGQKKFTEELDKQVTQLKVEPWLTLPRDSTWKKLLDLREILWSLWFQWSYNWYPSPKLMSWQQKVQEVWLSLRKSRKKTMLAKLIQELREELKFGRYTPRLFQAVDASLTSEDDVRLADDTRDAEEAEEEQIKVLEKHKAKALVQQRILHKNFHKVVNESQHAIMEEFIETLQNYKSGKLPDYPDGMLQQSLRFPWNIENTKMARLLSLELLLSSISAGDMVKAREVADKISSSNYLRKIARHLKVYDLVRVITKRTLDTQEVQQAAAQLYNATKMVELTADKQEYELVMQHLLGIFAVDAHEYNMVSYLSRLRPRHRLLQPSDESLILYRTITDDTDLYTCSSGFTEDFSPSSFTYYLEVLEERGNFLQEEGNEEDYEVYKKQINEYNKVLKKYWKHDDAFLKDTEFYIFEGHEYECSACNGKTGLKKRNIELRIFNTKVKLKFTLRDKLKERMSLSRLSEDPRPWKRKKEKEERKGIHIRSPDIKRLAPSFYDGAGHKVAEFMLVMPCLGTRICKDDVEGLTPEDYFDRQPLAYVREAAVGHPVKLQCPTRYPAKVEWYFNGYPLLPTQQVFINKAQVGITKVSANNTGNYSCVVTVTRGTKTTMLPQGFVYLKLNTKTVELQFYTALYDLVVLFVLVLLVQVPISCISPLHKWYQVEARRYTLMISTLYRLKTAIDNMGKTADFREAQKLKRLRVIMAAIESRNVCNMARLQEQLLQRTEGPKDEEEWLTLLANEIWKLQNTTGSQAV